MPARSLVVVLVGTLLTAGCLGLPGESPGPTPDAPYEPGWPDAGDAPVRPGVKVVSASGQCTSNFVFQSPDNRSLYLGLAAHCVHGMDLGEPVEIAGGAATGTLAYSSWITMAINRDPDARTAGADTCDNEPDDRVCNLNDFALIRVDDAHRDLVHPAVRHFGGPVALADSSTVAVGDKVLAYGNSGLRPEDAEPAHWHEGYVTEKSHPWTTTVYTATPGIPGDSGSGVMTGDGRALGIRVTLGIVPPGGNGVTSLDLALDYAREHGDVDVRLATWDVLDAGALPGAG